ncbi:MAG: zinc transporter ZupT [Candidatus Thermoplasmatota archaeon]|nr:zinc transporter ZupT [Candidatus Thermoplasmatota archaeon]
MEIGTVGIALLLTFLAGISTGAGGLIIYFIKKPKTVYLSLALGFAGGVMIYISFMKLLPEALEEAGEGIGILAFFLGIILLGVVDYIIPEKESYDLSAITKGDKEKETKLLSTSKLTAYAIAGHNFPEGMITFFTVLVDIRLGALIAIAVAIHNIPEGIAVAVPYYYATGDKFKAFLHSLVAGVAEPIGALVAFLILWNFLTPPLIVTMLAFVAGIMVYISFDELLPLAHDYDSSHSAILGIVLGMLVMAFTFLIL